MKDEVVVYVLVKDLIRVGGRSYETILKDLMASGIINSYEPVMSLKVDKTKAIHIEAALEGFYDAPISITMKTLKGDK